MSHVAIIAANLCIEPYPVYPLGMAIVSAALTRAGHTVTQFDLLASGGNTPPILNALRAAPPDSVCLSIRNMDNVDSLATENTTWGLETSRSLIQEIRQTCDAPILVGGAGFSIAPEAALAFLDADYGVAGEGEQALPRLVDALAAGRTFPRLTWAAHDPMPMDRMPEPLHEPALIQYYRESSGVLNVQTKRGCPMCCNYCTYPLLEGTKFRYRPPEAVVGELQRLYQDHGVDNVFIADSIFNDPSGQFRLLLESMIRAELPVRWMAYFTPHCLHAEDVLLCKRAGLYAAELGTDASSDATLAALNKTFSWSDVHQATSAFVRNEIPCAQFIMFGGPGENNATLEEGLRNIGHLPKSVVFGFSGIRAFPGTAVYAKGLEEGLFPMDASPLESVYYVSPQVNKAEMDQRIEHAWAGHPEWIFPPETGTRLANILRAFGHKGPLWDKLLGYADSSRQAARNRNKKRETA